MRGNHSENHQHWRKQIEAQRSSGLSVMEFCRREGINRAKFYYWKRLADGARRQGFVELKVEPTAGLEPKTASPVIEVGLASGRTLRVPADFDGDHLVKLIIAIEGIA